MTLHFLFESKFILLQLLLSIIITRTQPLVAKSQDQINNFKESSVQISRKNIVEPVDLVSYNNMLFKKAIARYKKIKKRGGWSLIPSGPNLVIRVLDQRVGLLRERLILSGDLKIKGKGYENAYYFDQRLKKAVKKFQKRHGLITNGIVGLKTRLALNISVEHRIRQLRINKKRHHRVLQKRDDRYILVNIPAFDLKAVDKQKTVLKMRVIVGKRKRMTPNFRDKMSFLVINPFWYIPPDIVNREIIPKMNRSLKILIEKRIKVFKNGSRDLEEIDPGSVNWGMSKRERRKYYFRQAPGKENSLGLIKFILMNNQNIYLHDTPQKELFSHSNRAKSSGCIRLSQPAKLAAFVLTNEKKWSSEKISGLMQSGYQRKIFLPQPISVYLVYWTAWIENSGVVNFRHDIYRKDDV